MSKKTVLILILISMAAGYFISMNLDIFSSGPVLRHNTYMPRVSGTLTEESLAFSDIVRTVSPAVVNISTTKTVKRNFSPFSDLFDSPFSDFFEPFRQPRQRKEQSGGSGVIVSPDGYIITNYHVVEKADEIMVTLFDKDDFSGKIIGTDPKTDIAIIKISAKELPAVQWGNSDSLQVGEFVLAFGNPYGFSHTVTMGIVSAVGRENVGIADYEDLIQTDAAINPGNSGGPLVNIKGELVGINAAIFSRTGGYQGIGFAVPSNMAKLVMEQLINEGRVTRGWLGVSIQKVTPGLAKEFGLDKSRGALVSDIFRGSPAEKAGIRRGDVILEIDGKDIDHAETLRNTVAQSKVGSSIKLKIIRDGRPMTLKAKVEEMPRDIAEMSAGGSEEYVSEDDTLAGVSVVDLTTDIAKQLGLSREEEGVVIIRVEPYSNADEAGLKKGDVIQEINKKNINNLRDFNNVTSRIKEGDTVLIFVNRGGKKFYITLDVYS